MESPTIEVKVFLTAIRRGKLTVAEARDVISIPPTIRSLLVAFVWQHPRDGFPIEEALRFRLLVSEEFEKMMSRRK